MSTRDLIDRWHNSANRGSASERIFNICKHGGVLNMDHSPFGRLDNDLIDFRGYSANHLLVKEVFLRECDLSYADFSSSWMETNRFENCLFVSTDFTDVADHGNMFKYCKFINCKFKRAVLGYKGSRFENCIFKECGFQSTNFIRPEFVIADFINCRLRGIDFSASSFENCNFEGRLDNVWFRGTFPTQSQIELFGQPKINKMQDVSFENADLIDPTFSDGCDLSSVKLKNNGRYFKYDNWSRRLQYLNKELQSWDNEREQEQAAKFVNVHSVHAAKQDWYVVNLDDLETHYGVELARKIIETFKNFC